MMTGRCTCLPCTLGDETCSRAGPCEACKATMRLGERFTAAREAVLSALSLSAEQRDSLTADEQQAFLAGLSGGGGEGQAVSA